MMFLSRRNINRIGDRHAKHDTNTGGNQARHSDDSSAGRRISRSRRFNAQQMALPRRWASVYQDGASGTVSDRGFGHVHW